MNFNTRYIWLDLVRGLAAVAVCASHLRNGLIIDYREYSLLQEINIGQKIFYFCTSLGHEAVIVFFVLSGFFVGGSIFKNAKDFNLTEYIIARIARLWIVLIPALILTAVVDYFLIKNSPEILSDAYRLAIYSLAPFEKYSSSWITFFGNIFFLQGVLTFTYGTNVPLWSLAFEFWYYILFPLILISLGICRGKFNNRHRFISLTMMIGIFFILPITMLGYFLIWIIGVGIFLLAQKFPVQLNTYSITFSFTIFLASLIYAKTEAFHIAPLNADFSVAIGFSILCFFLSSRVSGQTSSIPLRIQNLFVKLSNISYSVYLSHFPFIVLIIALGFKLDRIAPTAKGLSLYSAYLIGVLFIGAIFWYLFERHTYALKKILLKTFIKDQPKS